MPIVCDSCGKEGVPVEQVDDSGNVHCKDCDIVFPVERTIYVHDEYADRDITADLYGDHVDHPRVGYEIPIDVRYYEDGDWDIVGVNGKRVE